MYMQSALVVLAAISSVQASAVLVQRAPELVSRDAVQGWSLQSSSAPSSLHSCGNGAYCPISLHCNQQANHEVAACCSSSSDCRSAVEGAPLCADPSWDLWVGYDGNGFCCESGSVGVYDISKSVAGTCVAPGNKGSLRDAVLTTPGTGGSATAAPSAAASSTATTTAVAPGTTTTGTSAVSSTVVSTSASAGPSSSSVSSGASTSGPAATSVAPTSAGSANNATSTAPAGATSTPGAGVKTSAGFSLMGVAFLALAML